MPLPQQFYLVSASNTTMAIQAGARDGMKVTLQPLVLNAPLQLWIMQAQVANGFQGVAFVNPGTGNSVTTNNALGNPLVMQPFSPNSDDSDAWSLLPSGSGNVRIADVQNNSCSWNDWGGRLQPGDTIALFNDTFFNSSWTIQLAGVGGETPTQVAVPAIVGEPAGEPA